jgi:hypothetical protein
LNEEDLINSYLKIKNQIEQMTTKQEIETKGTEILKKFQCCLFHLGLRNDIKNVLNYHWRIKKR